MHSVPLLVVVTLFLSSATFLMWRSQKTSSQVIQDQMKEIQRLTNLLSSKDPMTFSTIQTLTNNPQVNSIELEPMDDPSVAKRLADRYRNQGIDPSMAYDNPDDAIQDFGGPQGFI